MKPESLLGHERTYGDDELHAPPDPLPIMETRLPWKKVSDSNWNSGTVSWTVTDAVVQVTGDDGQELGLVQACFGGFLEVHVNRENGFETWRLDPREAWYAVTEQLQRANAGEAQAPSHSPELKRLINEVGA